MTLLIDYSFVASSHTAWATGSVDQSELRIHLFAPRSTINDSLWTSCRMLFLVYPMGESYWWVCLLFWHSVAYWSISNLTMDMMDLGVAGELLVIWFAVLTFWTSSPYLTWQWIWRIWVWYCFLCWDFVTSWPDVMSILAMHDGGLGCAWNGVISTWAMDMVGICMKWSALNLKPSTMCTRGSTVTWHFSPGVKQQGCMSSGHEQLSIGTQLPSQASIQVSCSSH